MNLPAPLKKKIGPLPAGAWLLIIAAGVGIGLYLRRQNADAEAEPMEEEVGQEPIPYSALPSESYGDTGYPLTGGGPPIVGGSALRIEGPRDPIRIIIRGSGTKKKKRRKGAVPPITRHCRQGMRWSARQRRCVPIRRAG